jgi:hypothetical protein
VNIQARYFDTPEEAIKIAKQRASSNYCTHYIVPNFENPPRFFITRKRVGNRAIIKVHFDGTVERLNQEETAK